MQEAVWKASRVDTWQRVFNFSDGMNSLVEGEYEMNTLYRALLTLSEPRPTTSRLAQYARTRTADDNGLRMGEDRGDIEASYENPTWYQQPGHGN